MSATIGEPLSDWFLAMPEREQREVSLARQYTRIYNHGTPGHLSYQVIAALADRLDTLERDNKKLLRGQGDV